MVFEALVISLVCRMLRGKKSVRGVAKKEVLLIVVQEEEWILCGKGEDSRYERHEPCWQEHDQEAQEQRPAIRRQHLPIGLREQSIRTCDCLKIVPERR